MAYTTPTLYVSGNVLTAVQMNLLRSDFEEVAKPPSAHAYVTTSQSIAHNAITTLNLASTLILRNITFGSSQFTISEAGYYLATLHVLWGSSVAGGIRILRLLQNGTVISEQHDAPGANAIWAHHHLTYGFIGAATDVIRAEVYQTCGSALNATSGSSLSLEMLSRT